MPSTRRTEQDAERFLLTIKVRQSRGDEVWIEGIDYSNKVGTLIGNFHIPIFALSEKGVQGRYRSDTGRDRKKGMRRGNKAGRRQLRIADLHPIATLTF